jgi:hypothetical protein
MGTELICVEVGAGGTRRRALSSVMPAEAGIQRAATLATVLRGNDKAAPQRSNESA